MTIDSGSFAVTDKVSNGPTDIGLFDGWGEQQSILRKMNSDSGLDDRNGIAPPPGGDQAPYADDKPRLDPPAINGRPLEAWEIDSGIAALLRMLNMVFDTQLETASKGVQIDAQKQKEATDRCVKMLHNAADKLRESANASFWDKLFGILTKIFTYIGAALGAVAAIAAAVTTGGAAIGLAVIAVAGLAMMCANDISQANGGPEISLSNGLNSGLSALLKCFGVPDDLADKIAPLLSLATVVVVMAPALLIAPDLVGNAAASVALLSGADAQVAGIIGTVGTVACAVAGAVVTGKMVMSASGSAEMASVRLANAAQKTAVASNITGSATKITKAGFDIHAESLRRDATVDTANGNRMRALAQKIMELLMANADDLKKLSEQKQEAFAGISEMIKGAQESRQTIIRAC